MKIRRSVSTVLILLLLSAGLIVSAAVSRTRRERSAAEEMNAVLFDSANEQIKVLAATLDGQYQVLEAIADGFAERKEHEGRGLDDLDPVATGAFFDTVSEKSAFSFIQLANAQGAVFGQSYTVADRAYFPASMAGRRSLQSVTSRRSGAPSLVLSVPYREDGEVVGVLYGVYYEEALQELLVSETYSGGSTTYVTDANGKMVIRPIGDQLSAFDDMAVLFSEATFDDGYTHADLLTALQRGERGLFTFSYAQVRRAGVFLPLRAELIPESGWYIFRVAPLSVLESAIASDERNAAEQVTILLLFSGLAVLVLLLSEYQLRRALRQEIEETRIREEQYRIVVKRSRQNVFRYDIVKRIGSGEMLPREELSVHPGSVANTVEATIQSGAIAEDSAEAYRNFFARIEKGESPVAADIHMTQAGGPGRWFRYESTTLFSEKGVPQTALISYYDCTELRRSELAYAKWKQEIDEIPEDQIAVVEWNLTKDVSDGERGGLIRMFEGRSVNSFDARTRMYANGKVCDEDRARYIEMLDRNRLIGAYHNGALHHEMDFRGLADGGLRWMHLSVQLVPYPEGGDIKCYLTIRDVDAEKQSELALIELSERDPMTGLLNRHTFVRRIGQVLDAMPSAVHALMMLDVDGFKRVNDTLGHETGDRVLMDFAKSMQSVLRSGDIVGRIGGDEFMVFLPDIPYETAIVNKAEQLCTVLNRRLGDELNISVSIGIALYPRDGMEFEPLYKAADAALYRAKDSGRNQFFVYAPDMESSGAPLTEIDSDQAPLPANRTVLLCAEASECAALSELLANGYETVSARDEGEARALLYRHRSNIALAVADADAPGADGVMRAIQTTRGVGSVPILAITGKASEEALGAIAAAGAANILIRPFSREELRVKAAMLIASGEQTAKKLERSYHMLQSRELQRYREVLAATGTTVFVYDVLTRTYQASLLDRRATEGIFDGRPLADVLREGNVADEADIAELFTLVQSVASGEQARAMGDFRLRIRSGDWHWFRIQIIHMTDTDEMTPKLLLICNDVNEHVSVEREMKFRAERDPLTGLYNRETFFRHAKELIAQQWAGYYVLSCFDVDNFKLVNDQYGTDVGDRLLCTIADIARVSVTRCGGICCHVSADNFTALFPAKATGQIAEVTAFFDRPVTLGAVSVAVTLSSGRYVVDDLTLPVSAMVDRALLARQSVKGRYDTHTAYFSESMRQSILEERRITSEAEEALRSGQFHIYLQPQFNHATGALIGAEALMRWFHPERGLIYPGLCIPIFERNGFIYTLDQYVWEQTAMLLRKWLDEGRDPLPLSVNVSRQDVYRKDFYETVTGLVERYGLPVRLLRLEITESAFVEAPVQIIDMVERLRGYGFTIEIDDFGSGYSSLNTLKDVPANILKLDMKFLSAGRNAQRGGSILESIVRMAKWLDMPVIAEGVETREQADYLKSIGCTYVQGYLYAKPMPVSEYEQLAASSIQEHGTSVLETAKMLDNDAFWDPKSLDTLVFNRYSGGACVLELIAGRVEVLRVNDKYVEMLPECVNAKEIFRTDPFLAAEAEDRAAAIAAMNRSAQTGNAETFELRYRTGADDAALEYVRFTVNMIARNAGRYLLYGYVENVTAQRVAEQSARAASERIEAIMSHVDCGVTAVTVEQGEIRFIFANDQYYALLGYTREEMTTGGVHAHMPIHPEDRARIRQLTERAGTEKKPFGCEYRIIRKDGAVRWVRNNISITQFNGIAAPVQLGVLVDITAEKLAEREIAESANRLRFLNDAAHGMMGETDAEQAIANVLHKVLAYFAGERAYVFEFDWQAETTSNTYEVCAPGVAPQIQNLKELPFSLIPYWLHAFEKRNHVYVPDVSTLGPEREERAVLAAQGIRSLVAVPLRRQDTLIGFIGIDDPMRYETHIDQLEAIGDYMAMMIAHRDYDAKMQSDARMLETMMSDTPGGFVRMRIGPDGRLSPVFINAGFAALVGMTPEEATAFYEDDACAGIHPDDAKRIRAELADAIGRDVVIGLRVRLMRGDGGYVWAQAYYRATRDESGRQYLNGYYAKPDERQAGAAPDKT